MRRWLLGKDDAVVESAFPVAEERTLWCTERGQVLSGLHDRSVFEMNAERARELARERQKSPKTGETLAATVRQALALRPRPSRSRLVEVGRLPWNKLELRKLTIETENGMRIPVLQLARPDVADASEAPLVLFVGGDRKALLAPEGIATREANAGRRVVLADLRGTGETAPTGSTSRGLGAFGADWQEAFLGLHLNRPLIGQRVEDILSLLDTMAPAPRGEVHLLGIGSAGPVALHAAFLDRRITRLSLDRIGSSWSDVASVASTKGELANVVPGVLKSYDLPDLEKALPASPSPIEPGRAGRQEIGPIRSMT